LITMRVSHVANVAGTKAANMVVCGKVRVLKRILGFGIVLQNGPRRAKQARVVSAHERLERGGILVRDATRELDIAESGKLGGRDGHRLLPDSRHWMQVTAQAFPSTPRRHRFAARHRSSSAVTYAPRVATVRTIRSDVRCARIQRRRSRAGFSSALSSPILHAPARPHAGFSSVGVLAWLRTHLPRPSP
jgi:hypothetical protein